MLIWCIQLPPVVCFLYLEARLVDRRCCINVPVQITVVASVIYLQPIKSNVPFLLFSPLSCSRSPVSVLETFVFRCSKSAARRADIIVQSGFTDGY